MKWLFPVAVLASTAGCASLAPLDEAERARVRVVVPVAARFVPRIDFQVPPSKSETAAIGAAGGAGGAALASASCGPAIGYCLALFVPIAIASGTIVGAAGAPSVEGLEPMIVRVRGQLGAPDVQKLLVQKFSERAARLTPYQTVAPADDLGPQSPTDEPNYSGMATAEGALVAEVAVGVVGASLVEPWIDLFGRDYGSRPLRISLVARMRLVRPSDGTTVLTRTYWVARYARRIQEYDKDATLLLKALAGAVDEVAMLMVDDAFLLRADGGPKVDALEPLPTGICIQVGYDCWAMRRVPTLNTASPRFRWKPFPETPDLEAAPWLKAARDPVYDLWIFGGDDDRFVEGLKTPGYTPERPLADCMRYSWAVRARFDTGTGPRSTEWSTAAPFDRSGFTGSVDRPTFGAPFITPCPAKASSDKR